MEFVIGFGVDGEPVASVNLLAPGGEFREEIFLISPLLYFTTGLVVAKVGNGFAIGFDDLEIVIVDPDASLKISFLGLDFFGSDVKDIAVQFVFRLLADIEDVVVGKIFGCEHERQLMTNVGEVFLGHIDFLQAGLGSEYHVLNALAFIVEDDVENFVILAVDGLAIERLHLLILTVGVIVAGLGEFRLFGSKALKNLIGSNVFGSSALERALLGESGHQRRRRQQQAEYETAGKLHDSSVSKSRRGLGRRRRLIFLRFRENSRRCLKRADTAATHPSNPSPLSEAG